MLFSLDTPTLVATVVLVIAVLLLAVDLKLRAKHNRIALVEPQSMVQGNSNPRPHILPYRDPVKAQIVAAYDILRGSIRQKNGLAELNNKLKEMDKTNHKVVQSMMFTMPMLTTWDADITREILFSKSVGKFSIPGLQDRLLAKSILQVERGEHRRQKKILSPAFAWDHIQSTVPHVQAVASELADALLHIAKTSSDGKKKIELFPYMHASTLDAIGKAGFGFEFHTLYNFLKERNELPAGSKAPVDGPKTLTGFVDDYQSMIKELLRPVHLFPWLDKLLGSASLLNTKLDKFDAVIDKIVARKKEVLRSESSENLSRAADLLDLMVTAHVSNGGATSAKNDSEGDILSLDDAQLRHNLNTFFIAGHETTAGGLSSVLYLLALNQECLRRAHEEVDRVCGSEVPTFEHVKEMTYVHNCLKEALRIMPPAGIMLREVTEDTTLGGYFAPKGLVCMLNVFALHHDEDYWEDPERFDPDRFLAERVKKRHHYAWMPFSIGPRQCIGNNFAMLEMRMMLAVILQKLHFEPAVDKPEISLETVIFPADNTPIIICARN